MILGPFCVRRTAATVAPILLAWLLLLNGATVLADEHNHIVS